MQLQNHAYWIQKWCVLECLVPRFREQSTGTQILITNQKHGQNAFNIYIQEVCVYKI